MVRVDENDRGGEVTFAKGTRTFALRWDDGGPREFDSLVKDRLSSSDLNEAIEVVGNPARLVRYAGTTEYVALWATGDRVFEFRGAAENRADFEWFAAALRPVPLDAWFAALPSTTVTPEQRATEVSRMLAGLPRPPGFDPARLADSDLSQDRYQLGAQVVGAVTCGWINEWIAGRAGGDTARASAAVDALAGSRTWPVLLEMNPDGDYPEVVWQFADSIAGDGMVQGGRSLPVEEEYRSALGC
jgi:hypothetical protein